MTGLSIAEHCELMAEQYNISREEQDIFALKSHQKAYQTQNSAFWKKDIISCWASKFPEKNNYTRQPD